MEYTRYNQQLYCHNNNNNPCIFDTSLENIKSEINDIQYCKKRYNHNLLVLDSLSILESKKNKVLGNTSLYLMKLITKRNGLKKYQWHNQSDQLLASVQVNKTKIATNKPGGQIPGGIGCDLKHGSYIRYLNKKKGLLFCKCK